jgi:iron complex outermembrane recepter protein
MKHILFSFTLIFLSVLLPAQQLVSGKVTDESSGEPLIGAVVVADSGKVAATTDVDGIYRLMLADGPHSLQVRYTGYRHTPVTIRVAGKPVVADLACASNTLKEVEIIADVAIDRETPVAFSNISEQKIKEEGGTRDITMLLNSTPGAYATEQGGGAGDSRVNIRGVDQRSVGVMVDGVPVNDMENGQVYWSNWDGLNDVTRTMQVQRGLGASRLALPSVGGTINILTKGIEQKRSFRFRTELGSNATQKLSFGFTSGEFANGWGITLAGSRKTSEGWADNTWDDAWSYFFKVQKHFGNHVITVGANGAPQKHGQRTERLPIAVYDSEYARNIGVNVDSTYASFNGFTTPTQGERGLQYNSGWGILNYSDGQTGKLTERVNFYHKPQFNASHFWSPRETVTLSTVIYLSLGNGGGTSFNSSVNRDTLTGQLNLTQYYNSNSTAIDALYSTTEHKSSRFIRAAMNNHFWYGGISTLTVQANEFWTVMGGIDARYYEGYHYSKVYDLFGGDYAIDGANRNQPNGMGNLAYSMKRNGDTIGYNNTSIVKWGGMFFQAEYVKEKWAAFVTVTGSYTSYQRFDYFKKKDVVLEDGTVVEQAVGYNEVYYTNGNQTALALNNAVVSTSGDTTFINNPSGQDYTIVGAQSYAWGSSSSRTAQTAKKVFPGYTIKAGSNYNISDHYNVYVNLGYMKLAPRFNTVFDNNNKEYPGLKYQYIYAAELGAGVRYASFAANLNMYYTIWENRPPQFNPTISIAGDIFTYDLIGLSTTTRGVELDFTWKPISQIEVEGVVSVGDWIYNSAGTVYLYDSNYELEDTIDYSAKGVHIGDAAQTQLSAAVKWKPIKSLWFKARYTWFDRYYASFDPIVLSNRYDSQGNIVGNNRDRESWIMPSYGLLDIYGGYEFREINLGAEGRDISMAFNFAVFNLLDTHYVSDAQNGYGFNSSTALVYMGLGRRWTAGLSFSF